MKKNMKKMIKKFISMMLTASMLSGFAGNTVFADPDLDNSSEINLSDEVFVTDDNLTEEMLVDNNINNYPTPLPEDYVCTSLDIRDVKVNVSKGDIPVTGAYVTLNDITYITDETGEVLFEDIPIIEDKYNITVDDERYGKIIREVFIPGVVWRAEETDDIPCYEANMSYHSETDSDIAELSVGSSWDYKGGISERLRYAAAGVKGECIYFINKNSPSAMYCFNTENNETQTINNVPSGINNIEKIVCSNEAVYVLTNNKIYIYNTDSNTWSQYDSSVEIQENAFIYEDNIYSIDVKNHIINVFDINQNTWIQEYDLPDNFISPVSHAYMKNEKIYMASTHVSPSCFYIYSIGSAGVDKEPESIEWE